MHSPHLTHLLRNSFSSREPGGLINAGSENPDFERGIDFSSGTATTPESYLLRTNWSEKDPKEIWRTYIQLARSKMPSESPRATWG